MIFMNRQCLKELAINVLYVVFKFKGAVPHKNLCKVIFMNRQLLEEHAINVLQVVFKFKAAVTHKKCMRNDFYELSVT